MNWQEFFAYGVLGIITAWAVTSGLSWRYRRRIIRSFTRFLVKRLAPFFPAILTDVHGKALKDLSAREVEELRTVLDGLHGLRLTSGRARERIVDAEIHRRARCN